MGVGVWGGSLSPNDCWESLGESVVHTLDGWPVHHRATQCAGIWTVGGKQEYQEDTRLPGGNQGSEMSGFLYPDHPDHPDQV